ncbi:UPF0496 protein At3g49070 [Syzygium oleosum]|uniref:UPF0496 protein At3g49070 n=1 Tax=Syzygium oleosum TaxID=219896 RepID=UPI0024B952A6|nr:UPF0496 protein At3g49070 [Syzygium oleosum]
MMPFHLLISSAFLAATRFPSRVAAVTRLLPVRAVRMTDRIVARIKRLLPGRGTVPKVPGPEAGFDLREEYASAFRTESYDEFWARVLALSDDDPPPRDPAGSTTAVRLPSYRLFAEHLLEPDQPAVIRILDLARIRPAQKSLLAEYFAETGRASLLCGALLKDVDRTRVQCRSLKSALQALGISQSGSLNQSPSISIRLTEFSNFESPLTLSSSSTTQIQSTQVGCAMLLSRLESSRNKAKAKLKTINKLRHGSATFLIVVTASLTIIVMAHGLAMLVAAPAIVAASFEMASAKSFKKVLAQLDSAAKGTYILKRDMDTISRLVTRINDELEHTCAMVRFWLDRGDDKIQVGGRATLGENECNFVEQLDELEEHLYLCFMTINRARNLVVKELLGPS